MTKEEGIIAAKTCYHYLKEGGHVRTAVPHGHHPDPDYIEAVKVGGNGPGAKDHKILYTYETFREVFEQAGFKVKFLEYFDETCKFHYREWDPSDGKIRRSMRFDGRNKGGSLKFTSITLDAVK